MSDRLDEFKGDVKKALGGLTGNKRLQGEGEVQSEGARAKRKAKGAGGALKEGVGKLTGDEPTQVEGAAEKLRGKVKRAG